MPFYKELQFLLTTTGTKIKRKRWPYGHYVSKDYDDALFRNNIIMNFILDGKNCKEQYIARTEDMVAEDWEIC